MDSRIKKSILISCLSALCIGNMMMLNVAAFLPTYIEGRNEMRDGWESGGEDDELDAGHNS